MSDLRDEESVSGLGPAAAENRGGYFGGIEAFDIHRLVAIVRRRLILGASCGLVIFALVILVTFQQTPRYTASAEVMLNQRQQQVLDIGPVLSDLPTGYSANVDSQVQLIGSQNLALRVVDKLSLHLDPAFNPALAEPPTGIVVWIKGLVPRLISSIAGLLRALSPAEDFEPGIALTISEREAADRVTAALILLGAIDAQRQGFTHVINISVTSLVPAQAAALANAVADQYLLDQLEADFQATERANIWLSERLEVLRQTVSESERAVELFRAEAGLLGAQGSTLTEQQLVELNGRLIVLRAELSDRQARLAAARRQLRGGSSGSLAEVQTSDAIRDLRRHQSSLLATQAEFSGRYGERHPEMQRIRRELSDVGSALAGEVQSIVAGLESEVQVARARLVSMEESVESERSTLVDNNSSFITLRELERDAETDRALYDSFLTRFKETSETLSLQNANARIISSASVPGGPSSPNLRLFFLFALMAGGAVGAAAIFLAELLDAGLRTSEDVEREIGLPSVASIPRVGGGILGRGEPANYLVEKPLSNYAEAIRVLRSSVLLATVDKPAKVVAITSALPGEGKTELALSLARMSAMQGAKTLLIDGDLRRRQLSRNLNLDGKVGLIELLTGTHDLSSGIVADAKTDLSILPMASSQTTPRDLFRSERMGQLMDILRNEYDLIVFDTAPLLAVAETREITALVDAVVLIALWGKTRARAVRAAFDILRASHAPVAGIALSQVDAKAQTRYGYGDAGYYYKNYKNYYTD